MNRFEQPAFGPMPQEDVIDLASYIDVVIANRWLIVRIAAAIFLIGAVFAFLTKPLYEGNILVQVEENPNSAKNLLSDVSSLFDVKTEATAEIEILRSRMVVSETVDNLRLFIDAKPRRFPIVGRLIAQHNHGLSEPGIFGIGGFAWGRESLDVNTFNVPREMEGDKFTLTVLDGGKFRIKQSSDLDNPLEGRVGQLLRAQTQDGPIDLLVARLDAKPGAEFALVHNSRLKTIETLQAAMDIAEKGKQSGIIGASLRGPEPVVIAATLNEIGRQYVKQNIERKTADAEKSLAFLDAQLPEMKRALEQAESEYNAARNQRGTVDLSEEAKLALAQSVDAQTQLFSLKQKRQELIGRFAVNHPIIQAVDKRISALSNEVDVIAGRIKLMPNVEQDILRLMRNVEVDTELYQELLQNAEQLRVIKAGKVGNVRLVDPAVAPEEAVWPKPFLILPIAALLGVAAGVVVAFIRNGLMGGVADPQEIERHTGLNVYATIPFSKRQQALASQIREKNGGLLLLTQVDSSDPAVESLRSLRTALQFATLDARNNVMLVTGPSPGVGKSFISANLASVLASGGKRVLLIDADLRKGCLNHYLGQSRTNGLTELILGTVAVDRAVRKGVVPNLDFLPSGTFPPNPAEMLLTSSLAKLLDEFSKQYDVVLIDTAPVLAAADAGILAARAGAVFLVTRADETTIGEVQEAAKQLVNAGGEVKGVLFNGLAAHTGRYRYSGKYSRYRYADYRYAPELVSDESNGKSS